MRIFSPIQELAKKTKEQFLTLEIPDEEGRKSQVRWRYRARYCSTTVHRAAVTYATPHCSVITKHISVLFNI